MLRLPANVLVHMCCHQQRLVSTFAEPLKTTSLIMVTRANSHQSGPPQLKSSSTGAVSMIFTRVADFALGLLFEKDRCQTPKLQSAQRSHKAGIFRLIDGQLPGNLPKQVLEKSWRIDCHPPIAQPFHQLCPQAHDASF